MVQYENQGAARPTEEPQRRSSENAEINQLARMMPDPAEDELFDDGMSHLQSCQSFQRVQSVMGH